MFAFIGILGSHLIYCFLLINVLFVSLIYNFNSDFVRSQSLSYRSKEFVESNIVIQYFKFYSSKTSETVSCCVQIISNLFELYNFFGLFKQIASYNDYEQAYVRNIKHYILFCTSFV